MRVERVLVFALIVPTLAAAAFQVDANVAIDPTVGAPGDRITATGTGFQPGTVEIYFDAVAGTPLATTPVDRSGGFTVRFQVPAGASPGQHTIIACRDRTNDLCREEAQATLVVPQPPTTTSTTTTSTTSTTSTTQPPIGISTTTTTTTIPGGLAVTTTTLGGDPPAPNLPQGLVSPTVTSFPPEGIPTGISNISITAVEVTQGLQNLANEFPLVEGRWTAIRIHGVTEAEIQTNISGAVEVIRLSDGNANLGIEHASNVASYKQWLNRVDINGSPYVLLDPSYAEGTLLIRAWVYANGDVDASNEPTAADNLFEVEVEFHPVSPVHIWYWPLYLEEDFDPNGDPVIWMPNDGYVAEHLSAYRLWPVNLLWAHPMNTIVGDEDSNFNLNFAAENSGAANVALKELWELADHTGFHMYNGMVSPAFEAATSPFKGRAGGGTTWTMMGMGYFGGYPFHHQSGSILTHESGHYFGLLHAPCSFTVGNPLPNEVPGGAADPTFPGSYGWPDCSLAPTDPEGYYGIDVLWELTPAAGPTVMSNNAGTEAPNVAFPFMGYKKPRWLDPWHGCFILDRLGVDCDQEDTGVFDPDAPGGGGIPNPASGVPKWTCQDVLSEIDMCTFFPTPTGDPTESEPDGDWLVHIDLDASDPDAPTAALEAMRVDGSNREHTHDELSGRRDHGGPYVLALVDENDVAIWARTLHVEEEDIDVPGDLGRYFQFVERVPAVPEGVTMAILSPSGTLARLSASQSPPELSILRVDDGEALSVEFEASDPDGDQVRVAGLYRPHPDFIWLPISVSTTTSRIDLPDTVDLPGSDGGELRLLASDGWHTVELQVDGIRIPEKGPSVTILQPAAASIPAGRPVRLEAQALDAEDGILDGESLTWSSDLDGELGLGAGLTVRDLSEGVHLLSVVATDAAGNTAQASIELEITATDLPPASVQEQLAAVFAGDHVVSGSDGSEPPQAAGGTDDASSPPWSVIALIGAAGAAGGLAAWRARRSSRRH